MNQFGHRLRIQVFGESHGVRLGVVIDGCPAGIELSEEDFSADILRRKAGAAGTTPRIETDAPQLVSGVYRGRTTGVPLTILFENGNTRSEDYDKLRNMPRPGHADFVMHEKFRGFNDPRGGGHTSGRLTLLLVAAGVVAKKIIPQVQIEAKLTEAGGSEDIEAALQRAIEEQHTIGGIVTCRATGLPIGWGEPFFDSVESVIAHLAFSIPAIKGVEFGSGFGAARMRGMDHNDAILDATGKTETNNAGGINGGLTNGNELLFRVAVKPTSSVPGSQTSWNRQSGERETFTIGGRHDLCIALRVPVVVEAITAIALADFSLR